MTPTIHWSSAHCLTPRPSFALHRPSHNADHAQSPKQSPCLALSKATLTPLIHSP
ncbi:hypothetical protein COCSADRAFT_41751 [Bipolaris sorokiniana ND90Pr]|uniref:Uncharacterized protein n=1 Tax=Cochliobolus sativus (strain ND90Pr / ATCC 201652) TaxID=665912 RepID=M2SPG7_COCSN|nr:uncharacterized protein COCSADRAFT_41751 [Bipolaris sorokiniana ND90Pr]EMD58637.1 hypothetical protein COCSADRAFT_41751 [Bipolaris sorokiniana ND90Pr]